MAKHALAELADRFRKTLLFDVPMERIEMNLVRRTGDVPYELDRLLRQVDHVGLEPVQGFDTDGDARVGRSRADLAQGLDAPFPFLLLLLFGNQTGLADR